MLKEGLWGDSPDFDGRPAFTSVNTYLLSRRNPPAQFPLPLRGVQIQLRHSVKATNTITRSMQ